MTTVLAISCSLLRVAPAAAETADRAFVLSWEAPPSCPNGETVRAQVLRFAALDGRSVHRLEARGVIETDGGAWRLVLTTRFENTLGERRLSASSCGALTDAAVLVLALILNPESEAKARRQGTPVTSGAPPSSARSLGLRALVDAHAGMQAGGVPAIALELGGGAGLSLDAASLRVSANYAPPFDVHLSGRSGPGGRLWIFSASGLGCWEVGGAVVVGPCAGVTFTRLAGAGIAVKTPHSGVTRWVSASLGVILGVPLGRLVRLQAGGQLLVPLHRPTLYFEDLGPVARPAVAGAEIWAGTELTFP